MLKFCKSGVMYVMMMMMMMMMMIIIIWQKWIHY